MMQNSTLFLFDTNVAPNPISNLISPPSWQWCILLITIPVLRTESIKPLELENVIVLHVQIGVLEVPLSLRVKIKLAFEILVG